MAKCLWLCGRIADSDEDVVPEWLRKHLGVKGTPPGRKYAIKNINVPGLEPEVLKRERPRNAFHVKAYKAVCQPCNNKWMSGLQAGAMDLLKPMIDGAKATLTPSERGAIGAWAAMTGITLEHAHRVTVDPSRRQYMKTHRSPPPHTLVYLTHLAPVELDCIVGNSRADTKQDHRTVMYHELFTARELGLLIFQGVFGPRQIAQLSKYGNYLVPVWPVITLTTAYWPPTKTLTIEEHVIVAYNIITA